ncbi:adenylylsulfate kinase [Desulfotomaculum arcticum]|uniref:Adenylyl-sulfate kinase n=1 Tax=Desulfotruncus arcticus DSM 17038 TaxID=1121424 RepID=A0A1I2QAF6_9FIRM|nr:adenylyl-sulfate kinase [Desulfotruncus arcticus]SFG22631.1 adenylylsulfate kinase [Desulfotomaculum arcticum] [Desulfotruncus arcticus DSM 17038]
MIREPANVVWHLTTVNKGLRRKLNTHKSTILWITGLSASGKSTLANALECRLHEIGIHTYLLDGDNIRHGLNKDLGFNPEDRRENIRRIAEVAKLFVDAGIMVITAFISPYREDRQMARQLVERGEFIEIYAKCPLDICEKRDPKGLYKRARAGKISEFTGITAPYEEPENPEITVDTNKNTIEESVNHIIMYLLKQKII